MPTLTLADGKSLFYTRVSPRPGTADNGLSLVLLHGAGGSHLDWPKGLRRLPETAVYAPDLPGHGRSPGPGCDSIEAYADVVAAFLDALHLRRVVLVGHSMGGAIAQTLALRPHPALAGLVLLGTGARLRVSPQILEEIQTDFAGVVGMLSRLFWSETAPAEAIARSQEQLAACSPQVMLNDFRACDAFDARAQVDQIQLPTLVISAAGDRLMPEKHGRFLADHIPRARFLTLPGSGHLLMVEEETAVVATITHFLREVSEQ